MKKTFFWSLYLSGAFVLAISLTSCSTENEESLYADPTRNDDKAASTSATVWDRLGIDVGDIMDADDDDWTCWPYPGYCLPTVVVSAGAPSEDANQDLVDAIENNTVDAFFSSGNWSDILPDETRIQSHLSDLQSGTKTVVIHVNSATAEHDPGKTFYALVDKGFDAADVKDASDESSYYLVWPLND